jgi:hypothetical protein
MGDLVVLPGGAPALGIGSTVENVIEDGPVFSDLADHLNELISVI